MVSACGAIGVLQIPALLLALATIAQAAAGNGGLAFRGVGRVPFGLIRATYFCVSHQLGRRVGAGRFGEHFPLPVAFHSYEPTRHAFPFNPSESAASAPRSPTATRGRRICFALSCDRLGHPDGSSRCARRRTRNWLGHGLRPSVCRRRHDGDVTSQSSYLKERIGPAQVPQSTEGRLRTASPAARIL